MTELIRDYWGIVELAVLGLVSWLLWTVRQALGSRATKEEHNALATRVASVETKLENLPGKDQLNELRIEMTRLQGELQTVGAKLEGFRALADRLHEQVTVMDGYLRERS